MCSKHSSITKAVEHQKNAWWGWGGGILECYKSTTSWADLAPLLDHIVNNTFEADGYALLLAD
jgi:hypothetical protein